MKFKLKQFIKCFLLFFAFMIISAFLTEIFSFTKYSSIISTFIPLVFLIFYFRKDLINDFKSIKNLSKKKWIIYTVIFFICYISVIFLNGLLTLLVGNTATNETIIENTILKNPILLFFEVVFITPFIEEVLCRLNFRKHFKNKWYFSLFTGLFFASLHLLASQSIIEIVFIIPYFIMGFYLGYIYFDSNSIFISIFYHCFNNLIAYIILIIGSLI